MAEPATPRPRMLLEIRIDLDALASDDPNTATAEVEQAAYSLGQALFEAGAEHNTRPDGRRVMPHGNGHHLAQDLAEVVGKLWRDRIYR
jgi:hypothetical protein